MYLFIKNIVNYHIQKNCYDLKLLLNVYDSTKYNKEMISLFNQFNEFNDKDDDKKRKQNISVEITHLIYEQKMKLDMIFPIFNNLYKILKNINNNLIREEDDVIFFKSDFEKKLIKYKKLKESFVFKKSVEKIEKLTVYLKDSIIIFSYQKIKDMKKDFSRDNLLLLTNNQKQEILTILNYFLNNKSNVWNDKISNEILENNNDNLINDYDQKYKESIIKIDGEVDIDIIDLDDIETGLQKIRLKPKKYLPGDPIEINTKDVKDDISLIQFNITKIKEKLIVLKNSLEKDGISGKYFNENEDNILDYLLTRKYFMLNILSVAMKFITILFFVKYKINLNLKVTNKRYNFLNSRTGDLMTLQRTKFEKGIFFYKKYLWQGIVVSKLTLIDQDDLNIKLYEQFDNINHKYENIDKSILLNINDEEKLRTIYLIELYEREMKLQKLLLDIDDWMNMINKNLIELLDNYKNIYTNDNIEHYDY